MAIEITKKTAAKLINAYIDSSQSRYAVDLIVNSLTGDKISKLVEILTTDEEPQTYKIGDFVGVRSTESYQVKDLIKDKSFDKLLEANLCKFTPEGYILFGMIKDSAGYGDFDKWADRFSIEVIYPDDKGNVTTGSVRIDTSEFVSAHNFKKRLDEYFSTEKYNIREKI